MATYYEEGEFAGHYVEDGCGWDGLVESAEERRERRAAQKAKEGSALRTTGTLQNGNTT